MFQKNAARSLFSRPVFVTTMKKTMPQGILFLLAGALLPLCASFMIAKDHLSSGQFSIFCKAFLTGVSLLAPFFVFPAFSHLFSKKKCDFIESLPASRLSFAASALCVCLLWLTVISLITLCSCLFAPLWVKEYAFSDLFASEKAVVDLFYAAICVLYVPLICFLAVSLCGRLEGAIFMLIVLLCVPGIVILSAEGFFFDVTSSSAVSPFHIIGTPFMRMLLSEEPPRLKAYQLLPALLECPLVLLAGTFVFTRRKSERCESLTIHPTLSRLLLCFVTLLPFYISILWYSYEAPLLFTFDTFGELLFRVVKFLSKNIYLYLFIASLPAFGACSLLIERRPSGMLKAFLTYLIVASATVLWIVFLVAVPYIFS